MPADQFVGTIGGFAGSYPEWKWLTNLRYTWRDLDVGLTWRFRRLDGRQLPLPRDERRDDSAPGLLRRRRRVTASTEGWLDGFTIRAGVENLTDEPPPLVPNSAFANTDPSQFDVLGRRYYVSLALHF